MFRKKRAYSNPTAPPPTASAASAAAQAFLSQQVANGKLSSAAAAAALRSHTTTPEPGSAAATTRQPFTNGVQRQGSTSSMTQRTFRSPSPGGRVPPRPATGVPSQPVPPLPEKSHKRTFSADQTPASKLEPATQSNIGRPMTAGAQRGTPVPKSSTLATKVTEQVRTQPESPASLRSINFSRPMSPPLVQRPAQATPAQVRPATSQGTYNARTATAPLPVPANVASRGRVAAQAANTNIQTPAALTAASLAVPAPTTSQAPNQTKRAVAPGAIVLNANTRSDSHTDPRTTAARLAAATTAATARPTSPRAQPATPVAARPASANASPVAAPAAAAAGAVRQITTNSPVPAPGNEQMHRFQTRAAALLSAQRTASQPAELSADQSPAPAKAVESAQPAAPVGSGHVVPKPQSEPARTSSVSPSRTPHFTVAPIEAVKHEPPPRSLSPYKSAMKSPSPRPSSPVGKAPSESDQYSGASDSETPASKRKSARVSFDEKPVVVGEAAPAPVLGTGSTPPMSPQYAKALPNNWPLTDDTSMGPRPVLPSFGSIRGRKTAAEEGMIHSPLSQPPESATTDASENHAISAHSAAAENVSQRSPTGVSSDHALGAIFSSGLESSRKDNAQVASSLGPPPEIAILPATPRIESEDRQLGEPNVSGSSLPEESNLESDLSAENVHHSAESQPKSSLDITDVPGSYQVSEADSEDVYSDAPEEQGLMDDGAGFASLDAIVESPVGEATPPPTAVHAEQPSIDAVATAPAGTAVTTDEATPAEPQDWEAVRTYWTGLSEQKKQEMEQQANAQAAEEQAAVDAKAAIPEKTTRKAQGPQKAAATTSGHSRNASDPVSLPKTLRSTEETGMRTSLRGPRPVSAYEPKTAQPASPTRPLSSGTESLASTAAGTAATGKQSKLQKSARPEHVRTFSEDSDSESSFRKRRRAKRNAEGGGYSMRRSMRDGPANDGPPTSPTMPNRFSLRSPSPTARPTANSSSRSSLDHNNYSLRGQPAAKKSGGGLLGFGKGKSKPRGESTMKSRFSSRFADSSDEDEPGMNLFRSRYADDSDSDIDVPPMKLTPVRGIPRKAGQEEGDSTELEDSDDEAPAKPSAVATTANGPLTGKAMQAGTLRPQSPALSKSKRGFLGIGRKRESPIPPAAERASVTPEPAAVPAAAAISPASPASPQQQPSIGSPAQPTDGPDRAPSRNRMSRLFRRTSSSRPMTPTPKGEYTAADFPFPPPPIPDEYKDQAAGIRPSTSDGVSPSKASTRPAIGEKRISSMTTPAYNPPPKQVVVSERTGKKKRFQGLRRVFGLND